MAGKGRVNLEVRKPLREVTGIQTEKMKFPAHEGACSFAHMFEYPYRRLYTDDCTAHIHQCVNIQQPEEFNRAMGLRVLVSRIRDDERLLAWYDSTTAGV